MRRRKFLSAMVGGRYLVSALFIVTSLVSTNVFGQDPDPAKLAQAGAQAEALAPALAASISYHPDLYNTPFTDGDGIQGITETANIGTPETWEYYRFCANEGDIVTFETHRTTFAMDPAQLICLGTTGDSAGISAFFSCGPDMVFVASADDNNGIPHGVGGDYADPINVFAAPATGEYTFMVFDFIPAGSPPEYEIHADGIVECTPLHKDLTSGPDRDGDGAIDVVVPVGELTPTSYDFTITWDDPDDTPVWIYDQVPAEWDVTEIEFDPTGLPLDCGEATDFVDLFGMVDIWRGGKAGKKCSSDTGLRWMPDQFGTRVSGFYWTNGWTSGPLAGPQGTVNRVTASDGSDNVVLATTAAVSGGPLYRVTDVEIDQARNTAYYTNWHSGPANASADEAIYRMDLDGSNQALFSSASSSPPFASGLHRLAVDPANGDVYFSRAVSYANPGEVSKVDVTGAGYTQLVGAASGWFYSGVALDNPGGIVYFGDGGFLSTPPPDGALNIMLKTGSPPFAVLVPWGAGNGMGKTIAYDPGAGLAGIAFYSGWTTVGGVLNGPANGGGDLYAYDNFSGVSTLIYSDPLGGIPDIEVNTANQRIYWTDYMRGEIRSANYDGSGVAIEVAGLLNPFGLALEIEVEDNTLNVQTEARCHDNKKNKKCRPTSCGALLLNYGAIAYEKDPATGELVLGPDGLPIVVAGPTDPICLAAVDDVNGDGTFTWDGSGDEDGDGLSDYAEACEGPTFVCDPDSDDDGVLDGADDCPLEGPPTAPGELQDPNGCNRQSQCSDGVDNDNDGVTDYTGGDQSCDSLLDDSEDFEDCPCFTSADIPANGTILDCGSNYPGFPDLAGLHYTDGRPACSGTNCTAGPDPQCHIARADGSVSTFSGLTAGQDATCRAHIMNNCANPNATLTGAPASATPFVD